MKSLGLVKVYSSIIDHKIVYSIANSTKDEKGNFLKKFFRLPCLSSNEVDEKNFTTKSTVFTAQKKTFTINRDNK